MVPGEEEIGTNSMKRSHGRQAGQVLEGAGRFLQSSRGGSLVKADPETKDPRKKPVDVVPGEPVEDGVFLLNT